MRKPLAAALLAACASTPKPAANPAQAQTQQQTRTEARSEQGTPDESFRTHPPPPSAAVEFHAPIPKQLRLRNGLPVFLIERHEVPLVAISLALKSGEDPAPAGKAGLSSLALDLLDEGTQARDAAAIARGFEDLAARYATASDADASRASVTA